MGAAFRRGRVWWVRVPTRQGDRQRPSGTRDRAVALEIERMLTVLEGRRKWALLEAAATPGGPIAVGDLFDAWTSPDPQRALDALEASLSDVDLNDHVAGWLADVRSRLGLPEATGVAGGTAERYRVHVRTLIAEGVPFRRSALTVATIKPWLAALPVSSSTKRRYHAALSSFATYLVSVGVLSHNPMRDVAMPKAGAARMRYLAHGDVVRLVEAQPEPYRTLSALVHGTGMELGAALAATREDVDLARRQVRARGTKKAARDRIVQVAAWAWPTVERTARTLLPNARLVEIPGTTQPGQSALRAHKAACKELGIQDYTIHDARHSYAVRALRAGATAEVVARQLGNTPTIVQRVYGRFIPTPADIERWERIADAQEASEDAL